MVSSTRTEKLDGSPAKREFRRDAIQNDWKTALRVSLGLCLTLGFTSVGYTQPVTGFYVNGAGGATFNQDQVNRASANFPVGRDKYDTGVTGLGSLGWGLGNGFRVEVEGNYRDSNLGSWRNNHGPATTRGGQKLYGAMANALFDMDIGHNWLYPYFGAGIGYGWQASQFNISVPSQGYSQSVGGTYGNFAYQAIFGLSFPVPHAPGLSVTTEYRFLTLLGPQSHAGSANGILTDAGYTPGAATTGNRSTTTYFNHSALLGLRYEFNPPPPPPAQSNVGATLPAPAAARTYLVFFDWDRSNLTRRARAVIEAAAQNATNMGETRINVHGYTDNSAILAGAKGRAYNVKLSLKRANVVKAELIRDGVAEGEIETRGFGSQDPLVQTGPNTREAQNRRVAIILK